MRKWSKSAQLGDAIGAENASALITKVKEEMAKNQPKTTKNYRMIIENAANDLGITLTEEQIQTFNRFF